MCDWWPLVIFCGCQTRLKGTRKEPKNLKEYLNLEKNRKGLYCNYCARVQPYRYYKYVSWLTVFMIPVLPYKVTKPFVGCEFCKRKIDLTCVERICVNCQNYRGDSHKNQNYCNNCGYKNK